MVAQVHEILIYNGKETSIVNSPDLPKKHPRIKEMPNQVPNEKGIVTPDCWRQYIGTWEIKGGRFYLIQLNGRFCLEGEEPLFAEWFSGVLRIPRSDKKVLFHMGFEPHYVKELYVKIECGIVTKSKVMSNPTLNKLLSESIG